ncbi:uncharacterized protein LOC128886746 isoform X2 [Hylaeus anthracinus]|uniref:uncharacterized protein LOC128878767 isoform X2 n=1 Tax=Hylaeus volcanicus TaxID=313075 RepID=UPI0023B87323|nr:uncharacterized protein LOC128878767 isoform X2 [Hylaeus volcanicus]XP_053997877.1 uncharacterized protein LOC128886746 isoform X2 [Hylaeus anthracinus]
MTNSYDSIEFSPSKSYNNIILDKQEKDDASTSKTSTSDIHVEKECSMSHDCLQLKETHDQCHNIVKACHNHQLLSKCPGCLKVFATCPKCSTIDQIIQQLKKCSVDQDNI